MNPRDTDISNMGRCVVCGKPVDMNEENLIAIEQNAPDHPDIGVQEVREGMARALRSFDGPQNHTLAQAYEDGDEIVMHESCHDETALSELYATEEQLSRLEDNPGD